MLIIRYDRTTVAFVFSYIMDWVIDHVPIEMGNVGRILFFMFMLSPILHYVNNLFHLTQHKQKIEIVALRVLKLNNVVLSILQTCGIIFVIVVFILFYIDLTQDLNASLNTS